MWEGARRALGYVSAVAVVAASTLVSWFLFGEAHHADVVMVFLLGVVVVAMRFGYGPSLLAAVASVVAFEFFFIPPVFSFAVDDVRHFVTFGVMLFVAVVISHLTKRIRDQAEAAAVERTRLIEEAHRVALRAETEHLRNALLSSVSHDLRTPLAVVTGATSALLEGPPSDEGAQRVLLETAYDGAMRLNQLVRNLLDMTRLEAGAVNVKKELQPLEEVVGAALNRVEDTSFGGPKRNRRILLGISRCTDGAHAPLPAPTRLAVGLRRKGASTRSHAIDDVRPGEDGSPVGRARPSHSARAGR